MRCIHQSLRSREFALRVNDFGTFFALSLGLLRHGAQHGFRHVYLLDLDVRHFHAPRRCVLVENALQAQVDLLAMREQFVQFLLAQDGAKRRLRELRSLIDVVRDFHDRLIGIDHAQKNYSVYFERDVVASDDVLRRNFKGFLAQGDPHHPINRRKNQGYAGALGRTQKPAKPKDDAPFILRENLDRADEIERDDEDNDSAEAETQLCHKKINTSTARQVLLRRIVTQAMNEGAEFGQRPLLALVRLPDLGDRDRRRSSYGERFDLKE